MKDALEKGLLTMENVSEMIMINAALADKRHDQPRRLQTASQHTR